MSDNWILLIPEDPHYVPDVARQTHARERFAELAPDAEEISIMLNEEVRFFDCGVNLERIICPSCRAEIPDAWWQDRLEDDSVGDGFRLAKYKMPCCGTAHTLHELNYEWPQGFGRFALEAMNPGIGALDERHTRDFQEILGTPLRVIYQHL